MYIQGNIHNSWFIFEILSKFSHEVLILSQFFHGRRGGNKSHLRGIFVSKRIVCSGTCELPRDGAGFPLSPVGNIDSETNLLIPDVVE